MRKPINKRPYIIKPKYKEKVRQDLDKMLSTGIIMHVEESEWISPMVIEDKKIRGIHICVDLCNLKDACVHGPFPTPFTDEILENVGER